GDIVTQGEHAGYRWQGMQIHTPAHAHTEGAGEVVHPGRAGDIAGTGRIREPFCRPDAQVHGTTTRVVTGFNAPGDQAGTPGADGQATDRGGEDDDEGDHKPPGDRAGPFDAQAGHDVVAQRQPGDPLHGLQRHDRDLDERLDDAGTGCHRLDLTPWGRCGTLQGDTGIDCDGFHAFGEFLQTRV